MSDERLGTWISGYLRAWASNDPEDLRALFTDDAVYETGPHVSNPWRGIAEIIEGWAEHADEPGSWTFSWDPLAVTEEVSIIQGRTDYTNGRNYSNLWVIRFAADGRARAFTEWYMERPA